MDKEIRLGRFDKWGYKNSFSKGELARELTYMNRDYDKLEQQCKKQKEVMDKAINRIVKETKSMPTNGCKIRLIEILEILNEVKDDKKKEE